MAVHSKVWLVANFVVAAIVIGVTGAQAAEVRLIGSAALKEVVLDLVPDFEKASGHKITTIWAGTEAITRRISGGNGEF